MDRQSYWEERYSSADRVWSGNPNVVLVREVADLSPGTALDLGCGEGADAVWLARQRWTVTAVDISANALEKAAAHAAEAGVELDLRRHDLAESFPEGGWDLVSAQFLYSYGDFPREAVLRRAAQAVEPGGTLLIEGHQDQGLHGPLRDELTGEEIRLLTTAEVIEELRLQPGEWAVLLDQEHDRIQNGPDGKPGHRVDSTIKLRRLWR
jgi:SAM-dependent methyltransferase